MQRGRRQAGDYPILTVGDRVTVRGHTITVVADDGNTHTVTIAKVSEAPSPRSTPSPRSKEG